MTPEDKLEGIARVTGMLPEELAQLLGYTGPHGNDRVREIIRGKKSAVGPLVPLLDYLAQGVDIGDTSPAALVWSLLPEFLELRATVGTLGSLDLTQASAGLPRLVMHTRFPRFIAVRAGSLSVPLQKRLVDSGLAYVEVTTAAGPEQVYAVPLDAHVGDWRIQLRHLILACHKSG